MQFLRHFCMLLANMCTSTSNVVMGHCDASCNVRAFPKACLLQCMVFLQRLSSHLELSIHMCQEKLLHPVVGKSEGFHLKAVIKEMHVRQADTKRANNKYYLGHYILREEKVKRSVVWTTTKTQRLQKVQLSPEKACQSNVHAKLALYETKTTFFKGAISLSGS